MSAHEPIDDTFAAALRRRIDGKTKPVGALGRIEALAAQIARVQGTLAPRMATCRLTIFAADHGIAAEGVSAYPQAVTRQMVLNFLDGNAAANVFARSVGAELRVVDAGVAGEPLADPRLLSRRIGPGTRNAAREPAMTARRARPRPRRGPRARRRRRLRRRRLRRDGHRQHLGRDPRRPQARRPPPRRPRRPRHRPRRRRPRPQGGDPHHRRRPHRAAPRRRHGPRRIRRLRDRDDGRRHARRRRGGRIVLVDGFIAGAAALVAIALDPRVAGHLVFAHRSAEHGHAALLAHLGAEPLLDLGMRLGEGTGALLAWPLVRAAAAMLTEMSSFESAGISGPA